MELLDILITGVLVWFIIVGRATYVRNKEVPLSLYDQGVKYAYKMHLVRGIDIDDIKFLEFHQEHYEDKGLEFRQGVMDALDKYVETGDLIQIPGDIV